MKNGIHPNQTDMTVTCACGNSFVTKGDQATMQVDICSACHPFFTGEERFVDKQGRIDKFKQKMAAAEKTREAQAKLAAEKKAKKDATKEQNTKTPQTFKQILNSAKTETKKETKPAV